MLKLIINNIIFSADDGSKQLEMETSENLPVNSCPSDKELVASSVKIRSKAMQLLAY